MSLRLSVTDRLEKLESVKRQTYVLMVLVLWVLSTIKNLRILPASSIFFSTTSDTVKVSFKNYHE